jgi:predicted RNA-binding Zn-ribbon protein involved in translation (DUF1610 family)
VENLDFKHQKLSCGMNRLLGNCGLGQFYKKLQSLEETYGVKIEYVNTFYTSQECTSCGFVHKDNRKTQAQFKCLNCGKKLNADVSSARTIKKRFFNNTDSTVTKNNSLKPNKQLYYVSLMNIFHQRNIDKHGSRRCALGHDENQSLNDLNNNV